MTKIRLPASIWIVGLFLVLLVFPFITKSQYQQHVMVMTLMAAVTASSWNIIGGYTGYTSLGHAAFFGLGGYLVALAHNHYGWHPFISSWFLAFIVAGFACVMGWTALRTQGSAFVVVTIAGVFILRLLALNLGDITNGARGLTQPRPGWGGVPWSPELIKIPFHYIMLALLCLTIFVSWRIRQSKFGMGLIAIREDEGKAESVGIDTMMYKVLAFGISS
ncbi:MAG TPA: branched-chain amino acid ABC transporter permease, partial [Anaerolineales bacterium]|nr:branched-chain amino acid ABC transporter permease [Anaerolineales bacterium]